MKHSQGYTNKRDSLSIRIIKLAPLFTTLLFISLVLGFCFIASN